MPSPMIRGDALTFFQRIHSARWTYHLVREEYVPLKAKLDIPSTMVSRDPTLPIAIDPSFPSLYKPALLVKAGVHGNMDNVVLVGGKLEAFTSLFSRDLDPPYTLLAAVLGR